MIIFRETVFVSSAFYVLSDELKFKGPIFQTHTNDGEARVTPLPPLPGRLIYPPAEDGPFLRFAWQIPHSRADGRGDTYKVTAGRRAVKSMRAKRCGINEIWVAAGSGDNILNGAGDKTIVVLRFGILLPYINTYAGTHTHTTTHIYTLKTHPKHTGVGTTSDTNTLTLQTR